MTYQMVSYHRCLNHLVRIPHEQDVARGCTKSTPLVTFWLRFNLSSLGSSALDSSLFVRVLDIQCSSESSCQLLRRADPPIVKKQYSGRFHDHVVVDGHDINIRCSESL